MIRRPSIKPTSSTRNKSLSLSPHLKWSQPPAPVRRLPAPAPAPVRVVRVGALRVARLLVTAATVVKAEPPLPLPLPPLPPPLLPLFLPHAVQSALPNPVVSVWSPNDSPTCVVCFSTQTAPPNRRNRRFSHRIIGYSLRSPRFFSAIVRFVTV
jgi:hypothetical protein